VKVKVKEKEEEREKEKEEEVDKGEKRQGSLMKMLDVLGWCL
jgi:hypothetical protein